MWRIAVAAVLAAVIVGFPQVPSPRASGRCTAQWRVLATPPADLHAVTALSPTNVWARREDADDRELFLREVGFDPEYLRPDDPRFTNVQASDFRGTGV
jgi:hypothetical protein